MQFKFKFTPPHNQRIDLILNLPRIIGCPNFFTKTEYVRFLIADCYTLAFDNYVDN